MALYEPTTCSACRLPFVVCEKQLLNEKASRRFWCVCPQCGFGFEVLAGLVVDGVTIPVADSACLFDCEPHACTHGFSWQCKAPHKGGRLHATWRTRPNPRKAKKPKPKKPKKRKSRGGEK